MFRFELAFDDQTDLFSLYNIFYPIYQCLTRNYNKELWQGIITRNYNKELISVRRQIFNAYNLTEFHRGSILTEIQELTEILEADKMREIELVTNGELDSHEKEERRIRLCSSKAARPLFLHG